MNTNSISFRSQLKGNISELLEIEGMHCIETENAVLELVVALSHYTEEGNALFPQVILCEDIEKTLGLIQGTDSIILGKGPKSPETAKFALKKTAPLTIKNWIVFINIKKDHYEYGIFRNPYSPTALSIRETIISLPQESDLKTIYISQISEKAVELIGPCYGIIHFHLSAHQETIVGQKTNICSFSELICCGIDSVNKESIESYISSVLTYAIKHTHGSLIAVISPEIENINDLSDDGIKFNPPIKLDSLIYDYIKKHDDISLSTLNAYAELILGILSCDGIVLFGNQAQIIGYNFFISQEIQNAVKPSELIGGARRRAYEALVKKTDAGILLGCYMKSADSSSNFYKGRL